MKFDISPSGIPLSCQYHSMCACYTIHRHEVHVGRSNGVVYITKLVCKVFLSNAHFHWSPLPDSHNSINSGLHKSLHMNIQTQNFHQPRTFQQIFEHVPNFECVYKPTRSHTHTHTHPSRLLLFCIFEKAYALDHWITWAYNMRPCLCTDDINGKNTSHQCFNTRIWRQTLSQPTEAILGKRRRL